MTAKASRGRVEMSAAAREHAMSYSRAWKLVAELNAAFDVALVERPPAEPRVAGRS